MGQDTSPAEMADAEDVLLHAEADIAAQVQVDAGVAAAQVR